MAVEIPLTQNKLALVDDIDAERVQCFRWVAMRRKNGDWYAARHPKRENGRYGTEYLHQFILDANGRMIDHRNHNGLDCQRHNMRFCTHAENMRNRVKKNPKTTSRFKGVSFYPARNEWLGFLSTGGKLIRLGYFATEIEAAAAYNTAARQMFGEFCFLNTILESQHDSDSASGSPVNEIGKHGDRQTAFAG